MKVCYKLFHNVDGLEKACENAAAFASGITPDRLISISHSQAMLTFFVTVWYWE